MDITLKNVRFVSFNPDTNEAADVRPLTKAEAEELWETMTDEKLNWLDEECDFAADRTDGQANNVDWELIFKKS